MSSMYMWQCPVCGYWFDVNNKEDFERMKRNHIEEHISEARA